MYQPSSSLFRYSVIIPRYGTIGWGTGSLQNGHEMTVQINLKLLIVWRRWELVMTAKS